MVKGTRGHALLALGIFRHWSLLETSIKFLALICSSSISQPLLFTLLLPNTWNLVRELWMHEGLTPNEVSCQLQGSVWLFWSSVFSQSPKVHKHFPFHHSITFPSPPKFLLFHIGHTFCYITHIAQKDIFCLEHPYHATTCTSATWRETWSTLCFLQSSVVHLSVLFQEVWRDMLWAEQKLRPGRAHSHRMPVIQKYYTFSSTCLFSPCLKRGCCPSAPSKTNWGGGKNKQKSRYIYYLFNQPGRENHHLALKGRLQLWGCDADEAPIFQQHNRAVPKHKLGIKNQKERIFL